VGLRKVFAAISALCALIALAIQFIPIKRSNPPSREALNAPPAVQTILRRACYDCHSNETRWPWYSHIAPISWLIVHDVSMARNEINFSEWGSYYPRTQRRKLEWMGRALQEEKMPPWSYLLMHAHARLTQAERVRLQRWVESALNISATVTSKTVNHDRPNSRLTAAGDQH
jgi:hypothetical protein